MGDELDDAMHEAEWEQTDLVLWRYDENPGLLRTMNTHGADVGAYVGPCCSGLTSRGPSVNHVANARGSIMELFHGKVMDGDRVAFADVVGTIDIDNEADLPDWSGHLTMRAGGPVPEEGRTFTLVLDDGRKGGIIIDEIYLASGGNCLVGFQKSSGKDRFE